MRFGIGGSGAEGRVGVEDSLKSTIQVQADGSGSAPIRHSSIATLARAVVFIKVPRPAGARKGRRRKGRITDGATPTTNIPVGTWQVEASQIGLLTKLGMNGA